MRHLFFILLSASLLSFFSSPPTGLIAYYSFDNCDARDDTGNGSDGRLFGSVECWCGIKDDGLLFDGIQDYVEFEGRVNRYFSTSDFTVSFYIRPTGNSSLIQSLISKRSECGDFQMLDCQVALSQKEVLMDVHETEHKDYPGLDASLDSTAWHHICLVRKGTLAFTYINGTLRRTSRRCSGVDISNEALLSFSHSPCIGEGVRPFKGVLDELKIFDRALTEEEVWRLYKENPTNLGEQDCFS